MASIISTGTTAGTAIALTGDTSGNLAFTTQNGANTITVPNATGTVMVSGNKPAFSAYLASDQSVTTNTWTKVTINTEEFDTNSNFDSSTNYRFTPTVAGYYQINASVRFTGGNYNNQVLASIYKNGSAFKNAALSTNAGIGLVLNQPAITISALIYLNGSTDYVELYANNTNGTTPQIFGGQVHTYFSGAMVRNA